MKTMTFGEISMVSGAGACQAAFAGYGGVVLLGVAAGLSDGVALIDGVGIWGAGAGLGQIIGDVVC